MLVISHDQLYDRACSFAPLGQSVADAMCREWYTWRRPEFLAAVGWTRHLPAGLLHLELPGGTAAV